MQDRDEPINATLIDVDGEAELLVADDGPGVFRLGVFVLGLSGLRHGCTESQREKARERRIEQAQ